MSACKENVVNEFAEEMAYGNMNLLYPGCFRRIHVKEVIDQVFHFSAAFSRYAYCNKPHFAGLLQGLDNVGRVAAGADSNGNVSFFTESLHLLQEDVFKTVIVADCGENRGIGC